MKRHKFVLAIERMKKMKHFRKRRNNVGVYILLSSNSFSKLAIFG